MKRSEAPAVSPTGYRRVCDKRKKQMGEEMTSGNANAKVCDKFDDYYIGLDVGTSSVGWAVTGPDYNILRFHGKDMWGVHLFDEASTAEERRMHRITRRRFDRRVQRLSLLRELMGAEVEKVDPKFFDHLKNSKFHQEDRDDPDQHYSIFNDSNYTDKDYHKEFPTIYHLRQALMTQPDRRFDIRLIYLAIAHILKSRGNFLNQSLSTGNIVDNAFDDAFEAFVRDAGDILGIKLKNAKDAVKSVFLQTRGVKRRSEELQYNFAPESELDDGKEGPKRCKELMKLLAGGKAKLSGLFPGKDISFDDDEDAPEVDYSSLASAIAEAEQDELKDLQFSKGDYDEQVAPKVADILGDSARVIESAKQLYDWSVLANILGDNSTLSCAMIARYEQHKKDLEDLKSWVKMYAQDRYDEIFKDEEKGDNYQAWIGHWTAKNNKSVCSREDFYKFLNGILKDAGDDLGKSILKRIDENNFLPKLRTGDNGVIPYQLHQVELEKILGNAEKHYPFLTEKDETGLSVSEKIVKTLAFRIPYYVGPLSDKHLAEKDPKHGHAWIVRKPGKEKVRILPWNFNDVVDLDACAENFIRRMTDKCTYLPMCDVVPKESLIYAEYQTLNQLNNLKINGRDIDQKDKLKLWNLCREKDKVSTRDIASCLGVKKDDLSGFDLDVKVGLKSYHDFKNIFDSAFLDTDKGRAFVEECILAITIFGDEQEQLGHRIDLLAQKHEVNLTADHKKGILRLRYGDWAKFSKEFLTEIVACYDKTTGECGSILEALLHTTDNMMQLLGNKYDFKKAVEEYNKANGKPKKFTYEDLVAPLYCSPSVKRAIWRTLDVVKDIISKAKKPPTRIFVEVAREEGKKGQRTTSRKQYLQNLYKEIKSDKDVRELIEELDGKSDAELRRSKDRVFLYFTQMGRCMYSGEEINLDELISDKYGTKWDIDHIYPQSKVVDNSLDNRVLVRKDLNHRKGDRDLCTSGVIQTAAKDLWVRLKKNGLISEEKYNRLMRNTELTADDLAGFVSRQLVETRQSTKCICQVLREVFEKGKTEIVYSHAGRVSEFRREFEFGKCRDLNDFHHAKDAYLNVVVGNVDHTKFTANPATIFSNERFNVQFITKRDRRDIDNRTRLLECERGTGLLQNNIRRFDKRQNKEIVAWTADNAESIKIVQRWMESSRILYTRYAYEQKGGFYDQNPLKAKDCGDAQIPLKSNTPCYQDVKKYGGYDNQKVAYYCLVEYEKKKKKVRSIKPIIARMVDAINASDNGLLKYCEMSEPKGLGLTNPRILVEKILVNSKFEFDGFPFLLAARSGDKIGIKQCVQLVVDPENEKYIKKMLRCADDEEKSNDLTAQGNLKIYDLLTQKLKTPIYQKRPSNPAGIFMEGRKTFEKMSIDDQCKAVKNMLNIFKCSTIGRTDLKAIGGSGQSGVMFKPMDITKVKSAYMIHESVTGLSSKRIDLNNL